MGNIEAPAGAGFQAGFALAPLPAGEAPVALMEPPLSPPTSMDMMRDFNGGRPVPLPHIPVGIERRSLIEKKAGTHITSVHESDHIFAAFAAGAVPVFTTVEPDSSQGYLGVTHIRATRDQFLMIAAAPSRGNRSGNGSDRLMVENHSPGISFETYVAAGDSAINTAFSPGVQMIFPELLTVLGKMDQATIGEALRRAVLEDAFLRQQPALYEEYLQKEKARQEEYAKALSRGEQFGEMEIIYGENETIFSYYGYDDRWKRILLGRIRRKNPDQSKPGDDNQGNRSFSSDKYGQFGDENSMGDGNDAVVDVPGKSAGGTLVRGPGGIIFSTN